MNTKTTRFGDIEFMDEALVTFPAGILGFPNSKRYVILDHERIRPCKWLQSVDEPGVAFLIIDPMVFKPDYRVEISPETVLELAPRDERDLTIFVVLTISAEDQDDVTANLKGPVLLNPRTRLASQIVLDDDWPLRYPISSGCVSLSD